MLHPGTTILRGVILQAPQRNHPPIEDITTHQPSASETPTPFQTLDEGTTKEAPEIQGDQPLDKLIPEASCQSTTSEETHLITHSCLLKKMRKICKYCYPKHSTPLLALVFFVVVNRD